MGKDIKRLLKQKRQSEKKGYPALYNTPLNTPRPITLSELPSNIVVKKEPQDNYPIPPETKNDNIQHLGKKRIRSKSPSSESSSSGSSSSETSDDEDEEDEEPELKKSRLNRIQQTDGGDSNVKKSRMNENQEAQTTFQSPTNNVPQQQCSFQHHPNSLDALLNELDFENETFDEKVSCPPNASIVEQVVSPPVHRQNIVESTVEEKTVDSFPYQAVKQYHAQQLGSAQTPCIQKHSHIPPLANREEVQILENLKQKHYFVNLVLKVIIENVEHVSKTKRIISRSPLDIITTSENKFKEFSDFYELKRQFVDKFCKARKSLNVFDVEERKKIQDLKRSQKRKMGRNYQYTALQLQ